MNPPQRKYASNTEEGISRTKELGHAFIILVKISPRENIIMLVFNYEIMIVFNYEILDDFLHGLAYRVSNEIFSQYIEPEQNSELVSFRHKLILQFIGRPDPNNIHFTVLYQIALPISGAKEKVEIIENLKKAFLEAGEVRLIQGHINEIIMSIS